MAKFVNTHQLTGKVGDKVYCHRKDTGSYVRSLGKYKNEPSAAQLACRSRLKMAVQFLSPLRQLLEECWTESSARKQGGFNGASGYFIKNTFRGEYPELQINYAELRFSKGRLAPPILAEMLSDDNCLLISWAGAQSTQAWPDDEAVVILYNEHHKALQVFRNSAIRKQEYVILELSEEFMSGTLHAYLFFRSYTGKMVSGTVYLGCFRSESSEETL